jgi:HK97 family phage major capsid protein
MNQRQIVEKAMITVSDLVDNGGYLNPEQSDRFLRDVRNAPTLLNDVRFVKMNAPKRVIENIGFGSRILKEAPASGTALGSADRSAPTTGKITLTTDEVIAEVNIPYDVLEDNIERGHLEDSIMSMIAERVSLDLEELLVLGDTSSEDAYLALFDGALQMATSHTVSIAGDSSAMGKNVFKQAILEMPTKYLRNRPAMRFYLSPDNETEYRDITADRQTGYGDSTLRGNDPMMVFGVNVIPAVHVPDTKMIFVDPTNLIMGIQRDIMIETDRIIRERVIVVVVTLRIAIAVETEAALTVITGIGESE